MMDARETEQMAVMVEERLLTVKEFSERMNVDEETVRRWIRNGRLHGYRPGGARASYRIPASEVERLLTGQPPAD
jgi:excisionase family DNA binding protein